VGPRPIIHVPRYARPVPPLRGPWRARGAPARDRCESIMSPPRPFSRVPVLLAKSHFFCSPPPPPFTSNGRPRNLLDLLGREVFGRARNPSPCGNCVSSLRSEAVFQLRWTFEFRRPDGVRKNPTCPARAQIGCGWRCCFLPQGRPIPQLGPDKVQSPPLWGPGRKPYLTLAV